MARRPSMLCHLAPEAPGRHPDPLAEQVGERSLALEAHGIGHFAQRHLAMRDELLRSLQAALHDIAMDADAERTLEQSAEMEAAQARDIGQQRQRQLLAEIGLDIVADAPQALA